jgi:hypothetical protein
MTSKQYNNSMWFFAIGLLGLLLTICATGCVSLKKHNELKKELRKCSDAYISEVQQKRINNHKK